MTWVVETHLAKTLRGVDPCPGVNVTLELFFDEEDAVISVMVYWHSPSLNLGWYPIGEIEYRGKTIYHKEWSENPNSWTGLFSNMAEFIEEFAALS